MTSEKSLFHPHGSLCAGYAKCNFAHLLYSYFLQLDYILRGCFISSYLRYYCLLCLRFMSLFNFFLLLFDLCVNIHLKVKYLPPARQFYHQLHNPSVYVHYLCKLFYDMTRQKIVMPIKLAN